MLGNLCLLMAPIGAIKLASLWMAPGPQTASAADSALQSPVAPVAALSSTPLSQEQRAQREDASAYAIALGVRQFGDTPFYYAPRESPSTTPTVYVEPVIPGAPTFTVQVIMSSDDDTKVLIDGRVFRVGDEFKDGWIVAEIDSFSRTVTIADPATSRSVTKGVRMPGEE
jgi:hypothetical protein